MHYAEHPVPESLRRHVECVWILRDDAPGGGVRAIYADGRCELIAHFAQPMCLYRLDGHSEVQSALLFAGQQRGPVRLQARGQVHCLGVRLAPAASALVAGAGLAACRDRIPDLRGVDAAFAAGFAEAARAFAVADRRDALWQLLLGRSSGATVDAGIEAAVAALDARQGDLRIATLAQASGLAMRSLQTKFLAAVGMTAKEYARVRRLQALLHSLGSDDAPLAQIAAARGYADQAHATHDARRLTGTTPARLLSALRGDPGGDDALRLAAAFVNGRAIA